MQQATRENILYLLTGSNIGDSRAYLAQALRSVAANVGEVKKASSVYRTAPWGNTNQQDFYNQVLCVKTLLSAQQTLHAVLQAEKDMGRERHEKWAPRTIDIDILFYNDEVIDDPELKVPHPLLHKRRFTLEPLNEIASSLMHPVLHKSIHTLLEECEDSSVVEKL